MDVLKPFLRARQPKQRLTRITVVILVLLGSHCLLAHALEPEQKSPVNRLLPPFRIQTILESPEREKWQQPEKVLETLGVTQGDIVADVGAGSGYFTFRIADKVGPGTAVYAVDIQQEMLDYIRKKIERTGVSNIVLVKSSETELNLPLACCSKILLVNTYYELSKPMQFMENLRKALKPGGVIAVIDFSGIRGKVGPPMYLRVPMSEVVSQMERAGFKLIKTLDFLEYQYFLIFNDSDSNLSLFKLFVTEKENWS